jgi:hypothetical protein
VDLNYLTLPISPGRPAVFAEARGQGPVFEKRIGAWVLLDPSAVTRLLHDDRLAVLDAVSALRGLEARYGVEFPNLCWAASVLPLLIEGPPHRQARPPLAKHVSTGMRHKTAWRARLPEVVSAALACPGKLEAMRGMLIPCIEAIFEDLVGVKVDFEPLSLTPIFDRFTGYRRFAKMEQDYITLRANLKAIGATPETEGTLASFVILGHDSLLASLGESVIQLMTSSLGKPLNGPRAVPPRLHSGVAIAERVVLEPFSFEGADFAKGDKIRMYFGGYNTVESETERLAFFGAGAHSCLGRSLAVEVWSLVSAAIVQSPLTVAAAEFEYDRGVVFTMPKHINLELI